MDKNKYIIGKWYKSICNTIYYFKVKSLGDKIYCEFMAPFNTVKNLRDNHISFTSEIDNVAIELTNLEEIQQYLPDGHPDKVSKKETYEAQHEPKEEEFKVGDWVYAEPNIEIGNSKYGEPLIGKLVSFGGLNKILILM